MKWLESMKTVWLKWHVFCKIPSLETHSPARLPNSVVNETEFDMWQEEVTFNYNISDKFVWCSTATNAVTVNILISIVNI